MILLFQCSILAILLQVGLVLTKPHIIPKGNVATDSITLRKNPIRIEEKLFYLFVSNGNYDCGVQQIANEHEQVFCRQHGMPRGGSSTWVSFQPKFYRSTHLFLGNDLNLCLWNGKTRVQCLSNSSNHPFYEIDMVNGPHEQLDVIMVAPNTLVANVRYSYMGQVLQFQHSVGSSTSWSLVEPKLFAKNQNLVCTVDKNVLFYQPVNSAPGTPWTRMTTGDTTEDQLIVKTISFDAGATSEDILQVEGTLYGLTWKGQVKSFSNSPHIEGDIDWMEHIDVENFKKI
jgi:hypothetical protein